MAEAPVQTGDAAAPAAVSEETVVEPVAPEPIEGLGVSPTPVR